MDTGILTNLLNTFTGVFSLGYGRILPDAQHLLSILAALEIFFAAIWWAFDDGQKVEVELIKKVMQIGFFVWVISNYQWLIQLVLKGFITTGEKAGGHKNSLLTDPSLIIDYGFVATDPIFQHIHNYSLIAVNKIPDIILTGLAGLLILLAYFALAIVVFVTYLEFYLVSVLGLILVPFGVFKHTSFLSEKVFGAVISFGIRLMVLAFILAVIEPVLANVTLSKDPSFQQVLTVLLTALTIAGLSWHAPGIASGLMAGSPSLGLGTVLGTGLAAAAGIAGAGGAMGLGSAVHAGVEAAKAGIGKTRAAAGAAISHAMGGGGGSGDEGNGGGGGGASAGASTTNRSPQSETFSSRSSKNGSPSGMPTWAQNLMVAQRAIPQDAQPGAGMAVPLKRD